MWYAMTFDVDTHTRRVALDAARSAALAAGHLLAERRARLLPSVTHKGPIDLVTDADTASEALVAEALARAVPSWPIVGEESGGSAPTDSPYWLVDPLDGTTNYVHGLPYYAVSIALMQGDRPLVGVVYLPELDDLFEAVAGEGARRNGATIRVSATGSLADALVATGFPYDVWTATEDVLASLGAVLRRARGIRRLGAAAVDLCYVAAGVFDAFFELRLKPWDYAAGALVVEEAGGRVSAFDGSPLTTRSTSVLATNGALHEEMLDALANA